MSETKFVKKITASSVMELKKLEKLPMPKAHTPLYLVYGAANGLVHKPTQFDQDSYAIAGRFEAIRASDHQRFSAEYLYLPGDAHERIVTALKPNPDSGLIPELQIGFNIGYAPGESPTGYVFTCSAVLDTKSQDLLADTRLQVAGMLSKLLPAPVKSPLTAPKN